MADRTHETRLNSVRDTVDRLGLGRSQIYELFNAEQKAPGTGLRSVHVGRRRLVPESAIVEYVQRLERTGDTEY